MDATRGDEWGGKAKERWGGVESFGEEDLFHGRGGGGWWSGWTPGGFGDDARGRGIALFVREDARGPGGGVAARRRSLPAARSSRASARPKRWARSRYAARRHTWGGRREKESYIYQISYRGVGGRGSLPPLLHGGLLHVCVFPIYKYIFPRVPRFWPRRLYNNYFEPTREPYVPAGGT